MTYDQIAEWAADNFNIYEYSTPRDFIDAVKQRFKNDGMDFPDKAGENLRDKWVQMTFTDVNEGVPTEDNYGQDLDYRQKDEGAERLDDIRAELRDRFKDFFESYPPALTVENPQLEIEAARSIDYQPEAIQEESQPPYIPEALREANTQKSWTEGIKSLGRNLWRMLGR